MQSDLQHLQKKIRDWMRKSSAIDVVLFGSSARSKTRPNDIDLCIIIKDEDEGQSIDIVSGLGKLLDSAGFKTHINIIVSSAFVKGNNLSKTLLLEGISIKTGKSFCSVLGLENRSLFSYTLKHFSPAERVKFHYLLKGRYGSEGILKEVDGRFLGTGTIIVPVGNEDLLKEIFDKWKVKYEVRRMLIS